MQMFGKQVEEKNIDCDVKDDENVYKLIAEREKRTESLIKRIKRLQWKQLESHSMEQLESFYKRQKKPPVSNNSCQTSLPSPSPKHLELPLSTANLPTSSDNKEVINLIPNNPNNTLPSLPAEVNQLVNNFTPSILDCAEDELLRSAVGIITANLKHLEYSYDSDATESSSGGESCDEFENVFSDTFHKPDTCSNIFEPIERKANNRWLNERSAIASRWTWLQAQVADLEFKIRQQNEMYRQLRASKGSIAFYCKEAPTNNTIPNCLNKSSPITTTPKTSLPPSSTTTTTPTTPISKTSKPLIQIPPAPLASLHFTGKHPDHQSRNLLTPTTASIATTTTTTSSSTSTIGTTTATDALSVDVSSFNFAENSPPLSDCTNNKLLNLLGSINEIPNTQTNISSNSAPNSNGLSDYSLPSVNSDSTISLSPPLETMVPSTSRTTPSPSHTPPPPCSQHPPPPTSFESCISTNQYTTSTTFTSSTSAPTTFSCTISTNATKTTTLTTTTTPTTTSTSAAAATTTSTCTTTASLSITPQKQTSPMVKECTPSSEEKHEPVNHLNTNSEKEIHHCARTLPLKQMRKRKLVRSFNAITIASRKIARYSTVQCTCTNYPKFVSPCVLCNGRFSHLQMVDTDCMPNYERYALLDPSYHPVLSLPTDVALGLYFSKILKKDTTTTASSASTLSALSSFSTAPTTKSTNKSRSAHSEFPFKFGPDTKKTQLNRGKSQAIISSTKLKKKYDGTTKKKYAKKNNNLRKRNFRTINDQSSNSSAFPSSGENSSSNSKIPIHRRRRSEPYAYDIDNIVIPYSIASTTRVEKLQYKEIITPKWRWVETDSKEIENRDGIHNKEDCQQNAVNSVDKNNVFKFDHEADETDEDTSDEAFALRHAKCEIDERRLRNLHLHQKTSKASSKLSSKSSSTITPTSTTTTTATTPNHNSQSPPTEIISSSTSSLTPNSHTQTFP